ncbi:MHYT domain-containing protein [Streptodolium elevatio]|uniref:MHYT domain-containing protein n=1 Tax=Streptodolium elevatio TaxID=3157996 RepID=A0ABV3DUB6_9ACTN
MGQINQFDEGLLTPVAAYAISCVGAVLGLACTTRAHAAAAGWARRRWFALGAFAIGGTGIWATHFVAMLGFAVEGTPIRYDVPLTLASLAVAVVVVGAGLAVAAHDTGRVALLAAGGAVTGIGVATMHYVGMAALRMRGHVSYDPATVAISVGVAIVAATLALYAALNIRTPGASLGAALAMGVAVGGMHYTGMTAVSVEVDAHNSPLSGAETSHLLAPPAAGLTLCTIAALCMVGWRPHPDEDETPARADAPAEPPGPVTIERVPPPS